MDRKKSSETVRSLGENAYFAASNSAHGFHSYYDECFDRKEITRLFAIKGGPGTGKSRFMRDVAEWGERVGWSAEMIYCSSDPDSLDGVILTRNGEGIAVLDATAPHVYEPSRPGYREEIVNLGEFWNAELLRGHRDELDALNRRKKEAYRRGYRFLCGYEAMEENRRQLVAPFLREQAIAEFAAKLMQGVPVETQFRPEIALMRSVGMCGQVCFDTYFAQARKIFLIEDCRGSARLLMDALYRRAEEKRLRVRVSRDPILPDQIDGLFLCGSGLCFALCLPENCTYPFRKITMRRFVDTGRMRPVRQMVNYTERLRRAMLAGAVEEMDQVRRYHFQIEQIYIAAMDFAAKEEFTKAFCESLFGLKNS